MVIVRRLDMLVIIGFLVMGLSLVIRKFGNYNWNNG